MSVAVREEVRGAVEAGRPVVALESTLISHGLPHPDNIEVARESERLIRAEGAVPATVGVVSGTPKVGLDAAELELMATAEGIEKLSARDLPDELVCLRGQDGAGADLVVVPALPEPGEGEGALVLHVDVEGCLPPSSRFHS